MKRSVIYNFGVLSELENGEQVVCAPRVISSPNLGDLIDGELAYDSAAGRIVYREGNFLRLFPAYETSNSFKGRWDFSSMANSFWIGVAL